MNLSRVLNHPKTGLNLEKLNIKWSQTSLSRGLNLNSRVSCLGYKYLRILDFKRM